MQNNRKQGNRGRIKTLDFLAIYHQFRYNGGMKIRYLLSLPAFILAPFASSADDALNTRAEDYLNTLTTIKTPFTQIAPTGETATGTFYLKRPERMRFDYDAPVPVVIVSTGKFLTYHDTELDQITNVPIGGSLAGFLAKKEIDFSDDALEILESKQEAGIVTIKIQQRKKPEEGNLTLEFTTAPFELKRFITVDNNKQETTIALGDAQYGIALEKKLFQPPKHSIFDKKYRR